MEPYVKPILLVGIGLKGCMICDALNELIKSTLNAYNGNIKIKLLWHNLGTKQEAKKLGLNISRFPTLLAYKNGKLCLGWEGFAALAPDEIKREMVEDVLRQVAALADEDDENISTSEMPQQVRHDNSGEIR